MWPEASKPVSVPAVKRLGNTNIRIDLVSCVSKKKKTHKDKSQFHPGGAPVPLSVSFCCSLEPSNRQNKSFFFTRTRRSKDEFCGTEPVRVVHGNREPDEAEEKVEHEDEDREAEDALVPFRWEVVDRDGHDQHQFGDAPDERPPFDVVISSTTGKVDPPYWEL